MPQEFWRFQVLKKILFILIYQEICDERSNQTITSLYWYFANLCVFFAFLYGLYLHEFIENVLWFDTMYLRDSLVNFDTTRNMNQELSCNFNLTPTLKELPVWLDPANKLIILTWRSQIFCFTLILKLNQNQPYLTVIYY